MMTRAIRRATAVAMIWGMAGIGCGPGGNGERDDGGSTIGNGVKPERSSLVASDVEGAVVVCRGDSVIKSITTVALYEGEKRELTVDAPTGEVADAISDIADRVERVDVTHAEPLRRAMTSELEGLTLSDAGLTAVTKLSGAELDPGCEIERAFERGAADTEGNRAVTFDRALWDAADTVQRAALIAELAVLQVWDLTDPFNGNQARNMAALFLSADIKTATVEAYDRFVSDVNAL